ncbi:DMT family transporter [Clostridium sp. A1-XYC3]|uniref:DMT family transporter n=1 Tax=Clostridium tanneri TaxID=3037988 RepID=A0ABU4JTF4_9CLOT|nr:DMT family transporter [Clostridium sp. A1-XYC3]MDW8801437.1 DMT family transporter [Clostridium sp. A1-XYC3]
MQALTKDKALMADIALLIVAIIWGGGFIAGKIALFTMTPFYLLSFRFLCSGLLLGIIFFKKMKTIDRKSVISGIILGLSLYIGQTLQTIGLKYTTAGKQAFLLASYTIIVPFISWIIVKKKPDIYSFFAGLLTLIGIGLLSLQGGLSISYGDSLSLMFAVVFAFQIVLIGIYVKNINPIHLTTVQLLIAGTLTLISALIFEPSIKSVTTDAVLSIGYLVIFNTTIAFLVQNIAQKYTSDTHASIIISLESVFGFLLSIVLMKEVVTLRMIVGCILIFTAVIVSKTKNRIFNFKHLFKKIHSPSINE